jgi:hypothetical protein
MEPCSQRRLKNGHVVKFVDCRLDSRTMNMKSYVSRQANNALHLYAHPPSRFLHPQRPRQILGCKLAWTLGIAKHVQRLCDLRAAQERISNP